MSNNGNSSGCKSGRGSPAPEKEDSVICVPDDSTVLTEVALSLAVALNTVVVSS